MFFIAREICKPDVSYPYNLFKILDSVPPETKILPEVCPREVNQICYKNGIISQAKGSIYLEFGKTKVIASVFDPKEISRSKKLYSKKYQCNFSYAEFAHINRGVPLLFNEQSINILLSKALEPSLIGYDLTNLQIQQFIYVLEDNGSALAASILAASLALVDGGMAVFDILSASAISIKQNEFIYRPMKHEEQICAESASINQGLMTISRSASHGQTTEFYHTGYILYEHLKKSRTLLAKKNIIQGKYIKNLLLRNLSHEQ